MRTFIAILTLLLLGNCLKSQTTESSAKLDQESYQLYLEGNFKELNKLGKQMIDNGNDYYYLRMRLGILAFNKQLYGTAIEHFKKALFFNSSDTLAQEYIFFGYIYNGQNADALHYRENILPKDQSVNIRKYGLTGLKILTTNVNYTANKSSQRDFTLLQTQEGLIAENVEYTYGLNIKASWLKKNNWNKVLSYNYFIKNGVTYNGFFPMGTPSDFSQHQLYFRATKNIYEGFELRFFGTFALFSGASTYGISRGNHQGNQQNTPLVKELAFDYLAGIGAAKRTRFFRFDLNASYSDLVEFKQFRGEAYVTFYPFESSKLYTVHGGLFQLDKKLGNGYNTYNAIGYRIIKPIQIELGMNYGNAMLSARNSGEMIINSISQTRQSIYFNINTSLRKGFSISLTGFTSETSEFIWDTSLNTKINPKPVNYIGASFQLTKYF